ncbi:MAG TPA: helix-turn-helix transcriptional regulator [Acidimicrobiia bacterium]|nr:helix-turn-helix transcriptional regulator [Acidimicrobiia bacterium]
MEAPAAAGLLMDTDLAPERMGVLLREARQSVGLSRRRAAKRTGVEIGDLRAYERGDRAVPDDDLARLRSLYGDALDDLVAPRAPVSVDSHRLVMGGLETTLDADNRDALLSAYAHLVLRLRGVGPGEPLPLRADDLAVLAVALGSDPDDVARRVSEVVGCTRAEAAALHDEVLRRRVLVPAAGLAIGAVAFASAVLAAPGSPAEPAAPAVPLAEVARTAATVLVADPAPRAVVTPAPDSVSAPAPAVDVVPEHAPPAADDADHADHAAPPAPAPVVTTVPPSDDVTVGIPAGETFIEIGEPLVVEAPGYEPLPDDPAPAG